VLLDLNFIARLMPELLEGAEVTVELALLTMAVCLAWGLVVALAQATRGPLGWLAGAYVQIARNTPLLIQMYLVYFGLSMAGIPLSGFMSGLLALCLQNGAYVAEIYRGGLQSVSARQFEAGRALGMRRLTLYRIVVLPQVVARVVAPLANQAISITKDTAQVAAIAVMDVMKVAQVWVESSANTYDVFLAVALIYLVLTSIVTVIARFAEQRLAFAT
jgi:His/Glu/Gln/Arg/opine family amino acid ABC transporter permease subunit